MLRFLITRFSSYVDHLEQSFPIHQVQNFPSDIVNVKHAHISHIALLPYN